MESSWIRDQTHVSCIGRWILYHWATRKVLLYNFLKSHQSLKQDLKVPMGDYHSIVFHFLLLGIWLDYFSSTCLSLVNASPTWLDSQTLFCPQAVVLGERRKLSDAVSIQKLSLTMECQSSVENLDEDGYTQLDFSSRSITRRPVVSEKGISFSFWLQHSHSYN